MNDVKKAARDNRLLVCQRAAYFVKNHCDSNINRIVRSVIDSIQPSDFRKTMELEKIPGMMADVYKPRFDDTEWYVKFFLDDDDVVTLTVLSCNWDLAMH